MVRRSATLPSPLPVACRTNYAGGHNRAPLFVANASSPDASGGAEEIRVRDGLCDEVRILKAHYGWRAWDYR